MSDEKPPIDAELVDPPQSRARRADPPRSPADAPPLHVELHAWPKMLRARCIITERGRRREVSLDGSLLVVLLNFINGLH